MVDFTTTDCLAIICLRSAVIPVALLCIVSAQKNAATRPRFVEPVKEYIVNRVRLRAFILIALTTVLVPAHAADDENHAPRIYFPAEPRPWETVKPEDLKIDSVAVDRALDFAMARKSSGVIILAGGRILAERHAEVANPSARYTRMIHGKTPDDHVIEDVASCQKSVTSVLVGIAQEKGLLRISDPVSKYLNPGWSRATRQQEAEITIRHLITMTSGLNDQLEYVAPPGSRWAYNSSAYARSLQCVAAAAGSDENELTKEWLTGPLGMKDSKWITRLQRTNADITANHLGFATSARDLARFGLLMLAEGHWNGNIVLGDHNYMSAATSSSQELNPAYGYLWWLNGKEFVQRGRRKVPGQLIPGAPSKLFAAQGALGRKCYVVPPARLVVVRLGDNPEAAGKTRFDQEFWRLLKDAVPTGDHNFDTETP